MKIMNIYKYYIKFVYMPAVRGDCVVNKVFIFVGIIFENHSVKFLVTSLQQRLLSAYFFLIWVYYLVQIVCLFVFFMCG